MKVLKFSSVFILACLFMWLLAPQLSAKHHSHKSRSRSTAFSLNLHLGQPCLYQPVCQPAYVARTTIVQPIVQPVIEQRAYYPTYYREVVVERPYTERVYIQPQFSYYSFWGR